MNEGAKLDSLIDHQQATDRKLDIILTDVASIKADVSTLKADMKVVKADVSTLKADMKVVKRHTDVDEEVENVRRVSQSVSRSGMSIAAKGKD